MEQPGEQRNGVEDNHRKIEIRTEKSRSPEIRPTDVGTAPDIEFMEHLYISSEMSSGRMEGIGPEMIFSEASKSDIDVKTRISSGIVPSASFLAVADQSTK
jgi:hypothetical protein